MDKAAPYTCSLKEYAGYIKRKEYWDDFSAEYTWSTKEDKLIHLGGFVLAGGSLLRALNSYAKDHDLMYRERIQHCILSYLGYLLTGSYLDPNSPLTHRIKRLPKNDLVQLLKDELKQRIRMSYEMDRHQNIHEVWIVSQDHLLSDKNLDRIERHHWRTHPEENFSSYLFNEQRYWDGPRPKSLW